MIYLTRVSQAQGKTLDCSLYPGMVSE